MITTQHWQTVYSTKRADEVSWFEETPHLSLDLIARGNLTKTDPIIDVGAGACRLVDGLLSMGHTDITCLDISREALEISQSRLGSASGKVNWLAADITELAIDKQFAVWHDRAVFHFLTDEQDRAKYKKVLRDHLRPDGLLIMATFSPHGPQMCSGLDIVQYDADTLSEVMGNDFALLSSKEHSHKTPLGREQIFNYCVFKRVT